MTQVELKPLDGVELQFLEHYGVKGMKWGVRRSQAELDRAAGRTPSKSSGSSSSKKKANLRSSTPKGKKGLAKRLGEKAGKKIKSRRETRKVNKQTKKKANLQARDLTTRELQEITKRIELERKFTQLTTPQKKTLANRVETFVKYANLANNTVTVTRNGINNASTIINAISKSNGSPQSALIESLIPAGTGKRRK